MPPPKLTADQLRRIEEIESTGVRPII